MNTVLFLCTGNYYRSRFAEILFDLLAQQSNLPWKADSRGLRLEPSNLGPLSTHTRAEFDRRKISYEKYLRLPLPVTAQDFSAAHHVIAVKEAEHRPLIEKGFPEWLHRVEFWHVHDLDCAGPDSALPQLEQHVKDLVARLAKANDV